MKRLDLKVDTALAFAVTVALELTCWLTGGVSTHDRVVTAVAAAVYAAPIAVRRRWPAAALVFSMAVVVVTMPLGSQLLSNDNAYVVPPLLLGYTAGAEAEGRRSAIALLLAVVLGWAWAILPGPGGSTNGVGQDVSAMFYVTALLIPIWLVGRYTHRHRGRTTAFDALATRAAADRDSHDAAAIAIERARIGSELQDIIAHSISAMVIQAGSARLLLRADPDRARDSILTVEETGRQALSDLRRLLGVLRKDDDPRALTPQPGLDQIASLIESLHHRGLTCDRRTVGDRIDLTPGIDLVAYRVIEAALQAAVEHDARHSSVTITYATHRLELDVHGDRPVPNLGAAFAPLAHRVELYRGELRTQATATGFALHARLSLDASGVA